MVDAVDLKKANFETLTTQSIAVDININSDFKKNSPYVANTLQDGEITYDEFKTLVGGIKAAQTWRFCLARYGGIESKTIFTDGKSGITSFDEVVDFNNRVASIRDTPASPDSVALTREGPNKVRRHTLSSDGKPESYPLGVAVVSTGSSILKPIHIHNVKSPVSAGITPNNKTANGSELIFKALSPSPWERQTPPTIKDGRLYYPAEGNKPELYPSDRNQGEYPSRTLAKNKTGAIKESAKWGIQRLSDSKVTYFLDFILEVAKGITIKTFTRAYIEETILPDGSIVVEWREARPSDIKGRPALAPYRNMLDHTSQAYKQFLRDNDIDLDTVAAAGMDVYMATPKGVHFAYENQAAIQVIADGLEGGVLRTVYGSNALRSILDSLGSNVLTEIVTENVSTAKLRGAQR